jgi:hypothetical protein
MALKAQQAALLESTNMSIVAVRQLEVDYWTSFYGSMGVQCAFLGNLAIQTMAQSLTGMVSDDLGDRLVLCKFRRRADRESFPYCYYLYWMSNVIASIAGLLALVISLFSVVYGQALALRGPAGSMVNFLLLPEHVCCGFDDVAYSCHLWVDKSHRRHAQRAR